MGTIASLITFFLILNPVFNVYLRENIIIDDLDGGTVQDSLRYIRGFTFSDSSTFGYGVTQGIIFGLALYESKFSSKFYFILFPILLSILFNARVGFVVAFISFILLYNRFKISTLIYFSIISFTCFFYLKNSNFVEENTQSIEWATDFFLESFNFISGGGSNESTYDVLMNDMIFFPEKSINILFGEGKIIMGRNIGSDVGYVNHIFFGGILYQFLLLVILLLFFLNFKRLSNNSFIGLFFLISILVINFKGSAMFTSHSFFRLFMLIYVVIKCTRYDKMIKNMFDSKFLG
jgi:hypothetical protein